MNPARRLLAASCVSIFMAAACGGGLSAPGAPSAPSGSNTATIAGIVNSTNAAAAKDSTVHAAGSGWTVTVVGTNLSASVDSADYFRIQGVPSGNVQLNFKNGSVSATVQIANVGSQDLIEIQVTVNGSNATIVSEARGTDKISICHRTDSGMYNLIDISVSAEPAHRAHGDAKVGERVPADPTKVFDSSCRPVAGQAAPSVAIKKSTNGEDADTAPGPRIPIGQPITWTYIVTNTGGLTLTNVVVVDNRGVVVNCNGQTTLAVGQSMTCTGSGAAMAGQYTNVGTVTASSTGGSVTDSDVSNYFGETASDDDEGPKVQICHRTGAGKYVLIDISINAEPAHRAHGDGKIGEPVPNMPGKFFGPGCSVI